MEEDKLIENIANSPQDLLVLNLLAKREGVSRELSKQIIYLERGGSTNYATLRGLLLMLLLDVRSMWIKDNKKDFETARKLSVSDNLNELIECKTQVDDYLYKKNIIRYDNKLSVAGMGVIQRNLRG